MFTSSTNLKGLCYGYLVHFVFNASYTSSFPMKLEKLPENGKITAFKIFQTKICLLSTISIVANNRNEL